MAHTSALRFALISLTLSAAPLACESPLLGDWDVEEARGVDYPIETSGEACTTTVTADMDLRERSEGLGGTYYERTVRKCFDQTVSDKLSWEVTVEEIERGQWIIDLEDDEAENVSLDCTLEDDILSCEDDGEESGDWRFIRPEDDE